MMAHIANIHCGPKKFTSEMFNPYAEKVPDVECDLGILKAVFVDGKFPEPNA